MVGSGEFMRAYTRNRAAAHELVLEASPVAGILRSMAETCDWEGTATELLGELNERADEGTRRLPSWPKTGRALAGALRRLAPNLRAVGIEVTHYDQPDLGRRRRQVLIKKARATDRSDRSDPSGNWSSGGNRNGENAPNGESETLSVLTELQPCGLPLDRA